MYYFFFSSYPKRRMLSREAGGAIQSNGNYGIHVVVHTEEEMGPDNYKKVFQTYQKLVPSFVLSETYELMENKLFLNTELLFDSLEKMHEFVIQFLKDCGEQSARIVAMTQYNQALQQSGHISQMAANVHALSEEILNPEYRENKSLLHKIFK